VTEFLLQRCGKPGNPGAQDVWMAIVDGHLRAAGPCRTFPNHRAPKSKGGGLWSAHYGCLALGEYDGRVVNHRKYGKCVLLNRGGRCASETPNPRHNGALYLAEVFIHSWHTETWPGSAGCPTVPRLWWPCFQSLLVLDEHCRVELMRGPQCR